MLEIVKRKNGKFFIRNRKVDTGARPERVHKNKLKTWIAFSQASHDSAGKTMEEVNVAVAENMANKTFKEPKNKRAVTQGEYELLLMEGLKKGISQKKISEIVNVVEERKQEKEQEQETIEQIVKRIILQT